MKKLIFALTILLSFACEEQNSSDYRDFYTGTFRFSTIRTSRSMCYHSGPTCVNGWATFVYPTGIVIDRVEKYESEQLIIPFDDGLEDDTSYRTLCALVSIDGVLTLPGYPGSGPDYFYGAYTGHDTIKIDIRFRQGMGGFDAFEITGTRLE